MKFINKYKKYICNRKLIPYIIVLTILLLSVGYSAFSSNLSIRDLYAEVRLEKDVRITGISVAPETGDSNINYVCELVLDIGNPGYSYGDEYSCDPGDGIKRTFYLLEDGDNTTLVKGDTGTTGVGEVSLIMNENIGSTTYWGKSFDETPTVAFPYLQSQTTEWTSVEVNMPTYEQIYSVNNSTTLTSTPWLYSNLGEYDHYFTSTYADFEPGGAVAKTVEVENISQFYSAYIRPVITINKNQIGSLNQDLGIQNNGGTTTYLDYNVRNIQAGIKLPNTNSSVTFNVQVTNIGSTEVGIKEITGLPDNLDYKILNYNLKDKICDEDNVCKLGIQKEIQVQIKYKEGYYDSSNTLYNVVANFNFQPFYSVTYTDIEGEGYPTEILGGETLTVDFGDSSPNIKVKINNIETTNYTYENGVLTLPNVSGNVEIIKFIPPRSFADDDWSTIIANVQAGNLSAYKVGDTKEIALTGFTNGEEGSNELYTIRIANISTPSECSASGFSQTACGFVIEFVDIITTHAMNSSITNVGGYPASSMYTYIQNDIYNALPKELKDVIIPTYVVSGHGITSGEENFVTEQDKVYLLSGKEVYGSDTYDTSSNLTRQLEYYSNLGVTESNNSGALKKLNGSNDSWWLRSAFSNTPATFRRVSDDGNLISNIATSAYGVAVAFRIG